MAQVKDIYFSWVISLHSQSYSDYEFFFDFLGMWLKALKSYLYSYFYAEYFTFIFSFWKQQGCVF